MNEEKKIKLLLKLILCLGSIFLSLLMAFLLLEVSKLSSFKFPVLACQNGWPEFIALLKKDPIVFVMIISFPMYILVQVVLRMSKEGFVLNTLRLPTVAKYLFVCFYGMFAIIFFFAICIPIT